MIIPPFLQPGDRVGVIATAKKVNVNNTLHGIKILESWALEVREGANLFSHDGAFAGTDLQRTADLQDMINDDGINAIFMVRGGYGSTRIIDAIDYSPLRKHPKWICGFSDITAFHLHLFNLGIASLHAPMPSFFHTQDDEPLQWFREYVFGLKKVLKVHGHPMNRNGMARGRLVGGNLSIICHTIGTDSQIRTDGNILFIEDIGEQLYHLDRMMVQLSRAGLLEKLSAFIIGQFTDMKDDDPFGTDIIEIIGSHVQKYDYPVCFDFPLGHFHRNFALPVGVQSMLEVSPNAVQVTLHDEESGRQAGQYDKRGGHLSKHK